MFHAWPALSILVCRCKDGLSERNRLRCRSYQAMVGVFVVFTQPMRAIRAPAGYIMRSSSIIFFITSDRSLNTLFKHEEAGLRIVTTSRQSTSGTGPNFHEVNNALPIKK